MILHKFEEYILESILHASPKFKEIILSLKDSDIVAGYLSNLLGYDIKTDYNFLDVTDKADTIKFISNNQAMKKIDLIPLEDIFKEKSNSSSVGRVVRKILTDNDIKVSDKDIEIFVNKFRAYSSKEKESDRMQVVEGEDIRKWYLHNSYCNDTLQGRGSLGNSCMRYEKCQEFFDIYVKNPEVCKLIILKDESNKLRGRAILWKTLKGYYLDRIYFTIDHEKDLFKQFAKEKFGVTEGYDIKQELNEVILQTDGKYKFYPYMDSFYFLYMGEDNVKGVLFNFNPSDVDIYKDRVKNRSNLYKIRNTSGLPERQDRVRCEREHITASAADCVWSAKFNTYVTRANAVMSTIANSWCYIGDVFQSKKFNDYFPRNEAVRVMMSRTKNLYDYYPKSEIANGNIILVENSKEGIQRYFEKDYPGITKIGDKYWFENSVKIFYPIINGDKSKLNEFYGINSFPKNLFPFLKINKPNVILECSEMDSKIFSLDIDMNNPKVLPKNKYMDSFFFCDLKESYKILESLKLKKIILNKKLSELKKASKHLCSTYYLYAWRNYEYINDKNKEQIKLYTTYIDNNFNDFYTKEMEWLKDNYKKTIPKEYKKNVKMLIYEFINQRLYGMQGSSSYARDEIIRILTNNKSIWASKWTNGNHDEFHKYIYDIQAIYNRMLDKMVNGNSDLTTDTKNHFGGRKRYVDNGIKLSTIIEFKLFVPKEDKANENNKFYIKDYKNFVNNL